MSNLHHVKMNPLVRYRRKHGAMGYPSTWAPFPRACAKERSSRRGMGYRGFMRFWRADPIPSNIKVETRLEQPVSSIRHRAAQFARSTVARIKGAVGRFCGR